MMYAQHMQAPTKEFCVSRLMRRAHRWLSLIFTATVIANFVAMLWGVPPAWVVYSPLPPLFLMLITGVYMFVLPYFPSRDRERERRKCHV
jgi:peptidoglycan/LPS O-acetylase OafA/YrhL